MKRRDFGKTISLTSLGLPLLGAHPIARYPQRIKPAPIDQGDKIALITPASALKEGQLEDCISKIETLGLRPVLGKHVGKKVGYLAGTDAERLEDLHWAFEKKSIKGIWCLRGGYGAGRLLPKLKFDLIRNYPKALIGYSDITALHNAIFAQTGLVSFHGPVATSDFTPYTLEALNRCFLNPGSNITYSSADNHTCIALSEGVGVGPLVGGNLSLLAALCGTPYLPSFENKLVFIEDVGESPYRLDRMLTQLLQANQLAESAGIILGQFSDWKSKNFKDSDIDLLEMLTQTLGHLKVPILSGFSIGHVENQVTLPLGINARIDTTTKSLEILENPFQ